MVIAPATLIPLFIAIQLRGKYIKGTLGPGSDGAIAVSTVEEPKPMETGQCGCCCYQRGRHERDQASHDHTRDGMRQANDLPYERVCTLR